MGINSPIKCRYCGVNAGPHRKEQMTLAFMKRAIDEVRSYGIARVIVFTGGEPFLIGEDLVSAVQYAAQKGFLTRIVTNAFWATSLEKAIEILSRLKSVGLTEINYSCDDFHQEYIPLDRVRWANEAACKVGVPALLAIKGVKNSKITPAYLKEYFGVNLTRFIRGQGSQKNNIFNYGVTVPVGWESETVTDFEGFMPEDRNAWKRPCFSPLEHIVLTPSGKLAICCGIGSDDIPETIIGSLNEKSLIKLLEDANNDLIVNWLVLEGPYGILQFIKEKSPEIVFRDEYVNVCHICHEIFTRPEVRALLKSTVPERALSISLKRAFFEQHREDIWNHNCGQLQ